MTTVKVHLYLYLDTLPRPSFYVATHPFPENSEFYFLKTIDVEVPDLEKVISDATHYRLQKLVEAQAKLRETRLRELAEMDDRISKLRALIQE